MNYLKLDKALSNFDLLILAKLLKIPLRGVYMLNKLPDRVLTNEMIIVNLDRDSGVGSHWVACHKIADNVYYFDPIGNLQPPKMLVDYWCKQKNINIYYNIDQVQSHTSNICGHLCLLFLCNQL